MISVEELEKFHPEKYDGMTWGQVSTLQQYTQILWFMSLNGKAFSFMTGKCGVRNMDRLQTHSFAKEFVLSILNYFDQKSPDDENITKYYAKYLNRRFVYRSLKHTEH